MLTHNDKYVRRNAVWAIGRFGPLARPVLADLCAGLKNSDPRTASGAAQALGNIGADAAEAVPALAEAMRGTNIVLCRLAAKALSQIGSPALSTLITTCNTPIRSFAASRRWRSAGWARLPSRPSRSWTTGSVDRQSATRSSAPVLRTSSRLPVAACGPGDSDTITPAQTPGRIAAER